MIIATVTALIILFSGGYEIFFAENVEKGIKKYVEDKDRRKELLGITKEIKTGAKTYNKERKANYKDFEYLFTSSSTEEEKLNDFFDNLTRIQQDYQGSFIEKRISVTEKLTDQEWEKILELSSEAYQKKLDKLEKKKKKEKDQFAKTRKAIGEIQDASNRDMILNSLESFVVNMGEFEKALNDVNVHENELLVKKTNSREELLGLYTEINEIREQAFESVVGFHSNVRSNLDSEEGEPVLAAFYKDLQIAPM